MIQLLCAEPGSGKTFFAVKYLTKFTTFDPLYREFVLNPEVLIISNIDGLKIKHWSLKHCLGIEEDQDLAEVEVEKISEFFSIANFEKIQEKTKKTHIILAIDEAHDIFPPEFKDKGVRQFFAYHRHLGLDVLLMTQGISFLTRIFNPLIEYIVHAVPRSKKMTSNFTYKFRDKKGLLLYQKKIPTEQLVFDAYTSFTVDESNKPKSAVKYWLMITATLVTIGVGLLFGAVKTVTARSDVARAKIEKKQVGVTAAQYAKHQVTDSLPLETVRPSDEPEFIEVWETLYLDGFLMKAGEKWYVYNGETYQHTDERFRNFDQLSKTVEYFGKKINPARRVSSRAKSG